MNENEFTEPFDLERFRKGEIAYRGLSSGSGYFFEIHGEHHYKWTLLRDGSTGFNPLEIIGNVKMRPASPKFEDGWIEVVAGQCPDLPGSGPWEWKFRSGEIHTSDLVDPKCAHSYCWNNASCRPQFDIVAVRRIPSADVSAEAQKIPTLQGCGQKSEESAHEVIQKEFEGIAEDIREIYRPLSQNEVMRIAGDAINGTRIGEIVTVDREVFAALTKQ